MFPLLKSGGKTFKTKLFLVKFAQNEGTSRFGFSVSKKVSKSAVVRNRLRRMGYRLLRDYIPEIRQNLLVTFSYLGVPRDEKDVSENLQLFTKYIK